MLEDRERTDKLVTWAHKNGTVLSAAVAKGGQQLRKPLKPGKAVKVEVEIWPTCMVFTKGHRIRLDVQPREGIGSAPYTHYSGDYNTGTNTIFTGGKQASYLLLPVIPKKK
jgi:predicted acyl esterase